MIKCPYCGLPLQIGVHVNRTDPPPDPVTIGIGGSGWREIKTLTNEADMPPSIRPPRPPSVTPSRLTNRPGVASYERRHPTRAASIESDLLVPLGSSLIWSTLLSIPTIGLPIFFDGWPWWTPFGAWAILSPLAWAINSIDFHRTLWTIESAMKRDLDHDGEIGQPPEAEEETTVRLELTHKNERGQTERITLPTLPKGVTLKMFADWCHQVGTGIASPSEVDWVGRGKPFTKTPYRQFLAMMHDNGVIIKDGPAVNSKWVVTTAGRRALPYWASLAKNHSPRARQT